MTIPKYPLDLFEKLNPQPAIITSYNQFEDIINNTLLNEYDAYIIEVEQTFVHDEVVFKNGDLIYWFDNKFNIISNIHDTDIPFEIKDKYISVMTNRFFGGGLVDSFPNFVQFCKEWLVQCDKGFWEVASKIDALSNIDEVSNDILPMFLLQYANNFAFEAENIPYLYDKDKDDWNYDNVRNFLRMSRKFALTKGTPQSLFFLFEMLGEKLVLRFPYKQLLKTSDYKPVYKINENGLFEIMKEGDELIYEEGSYISCKNHDNVQSLYRLHGMDEDSKIKWAYHTAILQTDLEIDKYKDIVENIVKPSGVEYFWDQLAPTKVYGEQLDIPDFVVITNEDDHHPLKILDIQLPENYEGQILGRDVKYSNIVEGIKISPSTNVVLLYKYIGDQNDWKPTSFTIYREDNDVVEEFMIIEIG